jgi:hypothetical protein
MEYIFLLSYAQLTAKRTTANNGTSFIESAALRAKVRSIKLKVRMGYQHCTKREITAQQTEWTSLYARVRV